jgi:hypothetical protein
MKLAGQSMHTQHIYGIDFSGAQDAGKKIWIAEGVVKTDLLLIENCFSARDLPNSGRALMVCLPALRDFIKANKDSAFGLDFPFGLPEVLVEQESWKEFIIVFHELYDSPDRKGNLKFKWVPKDLSDQEIKRIISEELP